jgi:hypothetical protein
MPDTKSFGKIVTFYSFKGGTGRSQLLANVAMIMASNQRRVAIIDWDLEAPGIHRYFRPFLSDPDISSTYGLIDMVGSYWDRFVSISESEATPPNDWADHYLDFWRYATTLNIPDGQIVLIPAGRQNTAYASKVSNFDWDEFYTNAGGKGFIEHLMHRLREQFDYILIDSRTGVSDTAGICTLQIPDDLVICFTYNNQNLDGAVEVAENARDHFQRTGNISRRIFPVPTRADSLLPDLLRPRREIAKIRLSWALTGTDALTPSEYWREVEQCYLPVHSYHETLACLTDDPSAPPPSLLLSSQAVTEKITDGAITRWRPIFTDQERDQLRLELSKPIKLASAHIPSDNSEELISAWVKKWDNFNSDQIQSTLLRLISIDSTGAYSYRSTSSTMLMHRSDILSELQKNGLILTWETAGGFSNISIPSTCPPKYLIDRYKINVDLHRLLFSIEEMARQWREIHEYGDPHLANRQWLDNSQIGILELRKMGALTDNEKLFLTISERRLISNEHRNRYKKKFWIVSGSIIIATAILIQTLIYQRAEHNKEIAITKSRVLELEKTLDSLNFQISLANGHDAYGKNDFKSAIANFDKAEKYSPTPNADLYRVRASALERLSKKASEEEATTLINRSINDYRKWVDLSPSASRRILLSDMLLRYNNVIGAVEEIEKASLIISNEVLPSSTREIGLNIIKKLREKNALDARTAASLFVAINQTPKRVSNN